MALEMRTNAEHIALRIERRARQYTELARRVVEEEGKLALELAKKHSSLTDHSLRDLAKSGHPYATFWRQRTRLEFLESGADLRRMGRRMLRADALGAAREGLKTKHTSRTVSNRRLYGGPKRLPHPAYQIHKQGGNFLRSWRRQARFHLGSYSSTVTNTARSRKGAPYAVYLQTGTSRMIPRPILSYIARQVRAQHPRIYARLYRQFVR